MQKTYKIVIASIIGACLLFTGCTWVKEKLQGAVDEVNQGIADTAKEVSTEANKAVEEVGKAMGGETEKPATEAPATETPAK
ncbi:MAG: hypothetical protein WC651_00145 [Candidatus Gracilibacteria bacterium]|jgi:hypothetical protein